MAKQKRRIYCKFCDFFCYIPEDYVSHLEKKHEEMIPEDMTPWQFSYYLRTGKTHGSCIVCKKETSWNEVTHKYNRFCKNPKCKESYRNLFKNRMIGKYGRTHLLNDPEQQKKMLANRKISGTYLWRDHATETTYTGSYEKSFLEFLDEVMNFDPSDIMAPSPHTYYYEYNGKRHFYIPDFYVPSLELEIEIKDGGDNANKHPKIQAVDKVKESLKDDVMMKSQFNYIKIVNKENTRFLDYLSTAKTRYFDNDVRPIYIMEKDITIDELNQLYTESSLYEEERAEYITESENLPHTKKLKFPSPETDKYLENDKECGKYLDTLKKDCIGEVIINTDTDELVGYVFVYKKGHKDHGFIFNVEVAKKYRGHGFGYMLTNDAIHKLDGVDLTVKKDNEAALHIYRKLGFVVIGKGNSDNEYYMKLKSKLTKDDEVMSESFIDRTETLYHGSSNNIDGPIIPMGVDLGDSSRGPGWSTFCWNKREYGYRWAMYQGILNNVYRKYLRGKPNMHTPQIDNNVFINITQDTLDAIVPYLPVTAYVYEFEMPRSKISNGHTSSIREFTVRELITNYRKIKITVTEDDIRKISVIIPDMGDCMHTKSQSRNWAFNRGLSSMKNTSESMINGDVLSAIMRAYRNGDIEIGDDISEWLSNANMEIRKLYPIDRIKLFLSNKNINESCKDLKAARELTQKVREIAKEYNANYYFVTDGASSTNNSGNPAVKVARDAVAKWERENGFDDKEDWRDNPDDFSNYRLKKESIDNPVTESYIFSQPNFEINMEKWGPGEPLWITGTSGDGKSTLTAKLAEENDALVVATDCLLIRLSHSKEKFDDLQKRENEISMINNPKLAVCAEYIFSHPELPYGLKYKYGGRPPAEVLTPYFLDFFYWVMDNAKINPKFKDKKIIVEGCDVTHLPAEVMCIKPLIIMGTSRLQSLFRRAKRNQTYHPDATLIASIFKYIKLYNKSNRSLDDAKDLFHKDIKKAYNGYSKFKQSGFDTWADRSDTRAKRFEDLTGEPTITRIGIHPMDYTYGEVLRRDEHPHNTIDVSKIVTENTYVISDLHFGKSDIKHDARIIKLLNAIPKNAIVLVLGDVGYQKTDDPNHVKMLREYFKRIKCQNMFLILGNHDILSLDFYYSLGFKGVYDRLVIPNKKWVFSHQPCNGPSNNYINFHGHIHEETKYNRGIVNLNNKINCWEGYCTDRVKTIREWIIHNKIINGKKTYYTESENPKQVTESADLSGKGVFHVSKEKNIKVMKPSIPNNFLTKNGYEEDKTPRVCFTPTIDQCLMALSQNLKDSEFYVYTPDGEYDIHKATKKEVPDSVVTDELWITEPVKVKCIGKIHVKKDKGLDGHKYTYGKNTAELYDWDWEELPFNESVDNLYTENVIFNKNDLCKDVDKFESGKSNVLLVTGFSGSGKSTLASQLASKYKAKHFELDVLDFYKQNLITEDKLKDFEPALYDFIQAHKNDKSNLTYEKYIPYVINWCKRQSDVKFIIEGLQLFEFFDDKKPQSYYRNPIIIKGTSGLVSAIRASKRNRESNKEVGVKQLDDFGNLIKWVFKDNKPLESLSKYIKE